MKYITLFIALNITLMSYAQKEGQTFCGGDETESYFPLLESKKIIVWGNTYYLEEYKGIIDINDTEYNEYKQTWENGNIETLYLREKDNVIYQYEDCCNNETIRLPESLEIGTSWRTADGKAMYKVVSTNGELKTPICNYKNLLVLKSEFKNGSFTFYYLKGYGYIGATSNNEVISFVKPRLNMD